MPFDTPLRRLIINRKKEGQNKRNHPREGDRRKRNTGKPSQFGQHTERFLLFGAQRNLGSVLSTATIGLETIS